MVIIMGIPTINQRGPTRNDTKTASGVSTKARGDVIISMRDLNLGQWFTNPHSKDLVDFSSNSQGKSKTLDV
jgi:hypothetical protein